MSDSLQKNNNTPNGLSRFQYVPNYGMEEENTGTDSLDPKKIISIILRYKWLILLLMMVGATAAWFYADTLPRIYRSSGTLSISSSDASTNDELSQIISQATGYGTNTTFANELEVLQSRRFSRQIADKLIMENESENAQGFPSLWSTDQETGEVYRAGEETVASRIRKGIDFRRPNEEANIVEVSFSSTSPREAMVVVNTAMNIYVQSSTEQNREAAESTAEYLENEKKRLKEKLEKSEQELRRYMDSTGIVQVDEQASGIVSQRASVETELQNIDLELKSIEEAISNYEDRLEKIKPGLSEQFAEAIGPRIQNSQQELADYEREKTLIITKNPGVLERNPLPQRLQYVNEQISRLKNEIKNLSSQLFTEGDEFVGLNGEERAGIVAGIQGNLVELRIAKNQNESRREALLEQKKEMDASFNSLPEGMVELAKLQRDVRINEELWLNVSRQYADMSTLKQSQFGFGRIIDPGEMPSFPISPNKKIILMLGIMLSGFICAGFIFVREFMDNSLKDVDQLRTVYMPSMTLSVIPTFEKTSSKNKKFFKQGEGSIPDELVMLSNPAGFSAEAIRRLKNNIIYQHGEVPPKTIAVTSAEKGDGKSTIVSNLAISFAEEGYRTLVIDADFRRPKIQSYFGLGAKEGLSDYLNANISVQQLIQDTDLTDLKIITAGKEIQRPENIGGSLVFKQLINKMEQVFDVIILDTPPFGIISDSTALLKNADTTLVVGRYRKTNRGLLFRTVEELGRIHANVSRIVLNDFDYRKEMGSYYGSGYYQALYTNYESYVK